ncbi:MAG: hypothetical protein E7157_01125 [Lactobacillales bacterium]|nr:hypothetical protein [Lactobacillales bacterium]
MEFLAIAGIMIFVLIYTNRIDAKKFIGDVEPYFKMLMEDDYVFLLNVRYGGEDLDVNKLFNDRIKNAVLVFVAALAYFLFTNMSFINLLIAFILAAVTFKSPYTKLQNYYKANLSKINQMLPYYLKSLEILVQHYTVPVALARSIETAPEIFKSGLKKLIDKIESGDSSIDPYMDFAKEYPVKDSMRMMRLLYRLSLGAQESKQEQLVMFSKNVSSLQNKMREDKYKARLESMEKKTMMMLFATGGGILVLLLFAMMNMMSM